MEKLLYIGLMLLLIGAIYFAFFYLKPKKLSIKQLIYFQKIKEDIILLKSTKEKILDIDKLYHKILLSYGYSGTFGEILKKKPNIIHDINKIWGLHKIRNKLVHDFDVFEEKFLIEKTKEYIEEIEKLLKKIS